MTPNCRKTIQLMRAKHFLSTVQRAGEHRRVLGGRYLFFSNCISFGRYFEQLIIHF